MKSTEQTLREYRVSADIAAAFAIFAEIPKALPGETDSNQQTAFAESRAPSLLSLQHPQPSILAAVVRDARNTSRRTLSRFCCVVFRLLNLQTTCAGQLHLSLLRHSRSDLWLRAGQPS